MVDQAFLPVFWEETVIRVLLVPVDGFPVICVGAVSLLDLNDVLSVSGGSLVAHTVGVRCIESCAVIHVAIHALHVELGLVHSRIRSVVCDLGRMVTIVMTPVVEPSMVGLFVSVSILVNAHLIVKPSEKNKVN